MKKSINAAAVVIAVSLLLSACSRTKAPGIWSLQETGFGDAFYSVNFVDEEAGWINAQADRSYQPAGQDQAGNTNASSTPSKKKTEDPLKANQGFEVLQTTDGGTTWKQLPNQFEHKIRSVWFVDRAKGFALTIDRNILVTNDGGAAWQLQRKAGTVRLRLIGNRQNPVLDQPEQIEHLYFIDGSTGWAWGGGKKNDYTEQPGVFLTTVDGGQTWNSVPFPFNQNVYSIFFLDARNAWASTEGDGFYKSADGGLNWNKVEARFPEDVFRSIFFIDLNHGWVVGKSGRLARTTDGGSTWQKMFKIKLEYKMNDIFFVDANQGWAVGEEGSILYTADAGENWLALEAPVPVTLMDIRFLGPRAGWIVGLSGGCLKFEPQP